MFSVSVTFSGGSAPFRLLPTRNCTSCCGGTHTVDLDASTDGKVWANATGIRLEGVESVIVRTQASSTTADFPGVSMRGCLCLQVFDVALEGSPRWVRHTAATAFPQCTLYNGEGLPLLPFRIIVSAEF